jgi:hypothetical protein
MSNASKKLKAEKKAKVRKEKSKRVKAQRIVEKKAVADQEKREPKKDVPGFKSAEQRASSKPSSRSSTPGRRTQGK